MHSPKHTSSLIQHKAVVRTAVIETAISCVDQHIAADTLRSTRSCRHTPAVLATETISTQPSAHSSHRHTTVVTQPLTHCNGHSRRIYPPNRRAHSHRYTSIDANRWHSRWHAAFDKPRQKHSRRGHSHQRTAVDTQPSCTQLPSHNTAVPVALRLIQRRPHAAVVNTRRLGCTVTAAAQAVIYTPPAAHSYRNNLTQ
jgi:hypothetical protein